MGYQLLGLLIHVKRKALNPKLKRAEVEIHKKVRSQGGKCRTTHTIQYDRGAYGGRGGAVGILERED